jgi:hypothetical protein
MKAFEKGSLENSHELTRMTRIIGWFSLMAVGAAGIVSCEGVGKAVVDRLVMYLGKARTS